MFISHLWKGSPERPIQALSHVGHTFVCSTVRGPSSLASAGPVGWLMKRCGDSLSFILVLFAAILPDYAFKWGRKRTFVEGFRQQLTCRGISQDLPGQHHVAKEPVESSHTSLPNPQRLHLSLRVMSSTGPSDASYVRRLVFTSDYLQRQLGTAGTKQAPDKLRVTTGRLASTNLALKMRPGSNA